MSEQPKSELMKLADHYYIVARNLRDNAQYRLQVAEYLERSADILCEESIREETMT